MMPEYSSAASLPCRFTLNSGGVIDLKFLRENPDLVRQSQRTRGEDPQLVDELLAADEKRRRAIVTADDLRAEQKAFGKKIGQASAEQRPALLEGSSELKLKVKQAQEEQKAAEDEATATQYRISSKAHQRAAKKTSSRSSASAKSRILISSRKTTWNSAKNWA